MRNNIGKTSHRDFSFLTIEKNFGAIQAGGTQSTMIFFGKNFFAKNHDFSVVFHGESENQHEKIRKRFFGPQKWIFVRKY